MLKKTTSNFNNIWETQGKNLSDIEITGLQIEKSENWRLKLKSV